MYCLLFPVLETGSDQEFLFKKDECEYAKKNGGKMTAIQSYILFQVYYSQATV